LCDKIKDIEARGARLFAIDPHESYRVRHMLKDVGLKAGDFAFPILADSANTVSATYGVAFQMNIHTEWSNRPATFILDKGGVIRYERRAKTYGDRPKPDQILKELDKLAGRGEKQP
jgi:peroxiredoxin